MRTVKYLAIVVLVLALVGVAYVRAVYSRQERQRLKVGMVPATEVDRVADSLRRFYADSIGAAAAAALLPSVTAESDSLRAEISHLKAKLTAADGRVKELTSSATRQFEKAVRAFYNQEVAALPADLSSYERGVSIKEIKAKAMKYFGVSADALGRILSRKK